MDPDLPSAHFTIGTAYAMKGMNAQARQAFLRALELDPNNVSAMNNFRTARRLLDGWMKRCTGGGARFAVGQDRKRLLPCGGAARSFLRDDERSRNGCCSTANAAFRIPTRIQIKLAVLDC